MNKQTMKGLVLWLALWCVVILLCVLPVSAEASVTVDGREYAEGGDVTDAGVDLSDVAVATYYRAGDGFLLYTPKSTQANGGVTSATLVMKNATVGGMSAFGIRHDDDLTVILYGDNIITSGDVADGESMGLAVYGRLRIEGEGSVTVHAGNATGLYRGSTAVFAQNGLTVAEDVTVTANAGTAQFSVAVQSAGQITVNGTLFANAGCSAIHAPYGSASVAVYADSLTLGDGGALTLSSGEGSACYPFQSDAEIAANRRITLLRDGKSYAWGGDASNLFKLSEFPTVPTYYTADCENRGQGYAIFVPEADGSAAKLSLYHARIGTNTNVGLYIQCEDALEIVCYGENHIETPDAPTDAERTISNAAIVANGKLTLTAGDAQATLHLSAGEGYSSYGIFARDLTVRGGLLTVSASDGVKASYGLYVRGSLAILDGARVTAEAGTAADSVGVTVLADLLNEGALSGIGATAFRIEGDVTNNGQLSDMTAPDVTVTVSDTQVPFEDTQDDTFDYFFRTEKAFRISSFDTDSRVRSVEYFIGAYDLASLDGVMWQTCGEFLMFAPDSVGIYRIYLRLTDTAGNVCILSSPALVWYEDVSLSASLNYLKYTKRDAAVTFDSFESSFLSPLQAITCVNKDGKIKVTVSGAYLETLDRGDHIVELIRCPFGKTYVEGSINDSPAKLRLAVSVEYYVPVKGAHYSVDTLNENGWCNRDFSVYAKEGYLISLDVDGEWTDRLTATEETESGVLRFYVKDTANGAISSALTEVYKLDKTAPLVHGVAIGATYYTTQCYTVTDANVEINRITVQGDRSLLHKQVFCDPVGNTLTVWFEIKPIAALTAPLSGLCHTQITSADAERVVRVLRSVKELNRTYATAEEILRLDAIIGDCNALLAVIEATQAEFDRLTDAVASFDAADVKSSDAEMLRQLRSDVETLLCGTHLTADERAVLRDCRATVASLMNLIARTQAHFSAMLRTFATYDAERVTADDRADLERLQATSAALLDSDRLTDAEKAEVREVESGIACLLERIAETEARIETLCATVSEYTLDTVTSADRDRLSSLLADLDMAIRANGLTDGQRYRLERMRASVLGCLWVIDHAAQRQGVLHDAIGKYRADAVTADDRVALTDWRASAVLLLAEPNLTAGEKGALQASVATCDLLLERIDAAKSQREQIEALARAYFGRNVLISDISGLQVLIVEVDTLLNGNHLTGRERDGLALLRAELCDLIAIAERAKALIDTDAIGEATALTVQSVTSADQDLLRQALKELTAASELCGAHYTDDELAWIGTELRECRELLNLLQNQKTDASHGQSENAPNGVQPDASDDATDRQRGAWVWIAVASVCLLLVGSVAADAVLLRRCRRREV